MKKIVVVSMLALAFQMVKAQDFKKLEIIAVLPGKLEDAKVELEKIMADPKAQAKPDGYLWKAKIYSSFLNDPKLAPKYPTAFTIADEAFKKYLELDPSLKVLKEKGLSDAATNIYSSSYKDGVRTFNIKAWDSASYYFKYAVKYSDILFSNKLLKSEAPFDTTSILYAGYASQNAQKIDDAVYYYSRLIDAKVTDSSYVELYKYVLLHHIKKNQKEAFDKYLAVSRKAYPKEEWNDYEAEFVNKNFSLKDKEIKYETDDATGKLNAEQYVQYGNVFVSISKDDKENLDSLAIAKYQLKGLDAFKKAAEKDTLNSVANFNAGITYYNLYGVYEDRVFENRRVLKEVVSSHVVEKDLKKKPAAEAKFKEQTDAIKKLSTDLEKPMNEAIDGSIFYFEKTYNILKDKKNPDNVEKSCLRNSIDKLANMFVIKRDKAAGKDPKAYDLYDAKYKLYDGLHK
jgi:hypothetical protein